MEKNLKETPQYDEKLVGAWVNKICEECMSVLTGLQKPFKYIGLSGRAVS